MHWAKKACIYLTESDFKGAIGKKNQLGKKEGLNGQ